MIRPVIVNRAGRESARASSQASFQEGPRSTWPAASVPEAEAPGAIDQINDICRLSGLGGRGAIKGHRSISS